MIPEVIEFKLLSLKVPIFSKTFSPFAPAPAEVVYFTLTTSPFDNSFPNIPSPNSISGIWYSLSSKKNTLDVESILVMSVACRYFSVIVPEVTSTTREEVSTLSFVSINLCLCVLSFTKVSVKNRP